jgi:crossover junction endodeoxyribonuclease RuvC
MMRSKKFSQMQNKNIILGIDPGYGRVGIAVIEKNNKGERLIHSECFETDIKLPHAKRLLLIGEKIRETVKNYKPKQIAVETLLWSKNKKTALQVAEARGVILLESARHNVALREFNPNQIKLAVTGYGKSDKKQVIYMVEKLIKLKPPTDGQKRRDDEYDAIAIALTCAAISLSTDMLV